MTLTEITLADLPNELLSAVLLYAVRHLGKQRLDELLGDHAAEGCMAGAARHRARAASAARARRPPKRIGCPGLQ